MEYTAILNCFKAVSHLCKAYKLIQPADLFTCSCILIKEKRYYNTRTVLCFNAAGGMHTQFYTLKINVITQTSQDLWIKKDKKRICFVSLIFALILSMINIIVKKSRGVQCVTKQPTVLNIFSVDIKIISTFFLNMNKKNTQR